MPMTVETALITRKSKISEYNTDSLNASGKTWPRETVHSEKGIKAAGTGKELPYYVLASSPFKGTAESAADLFKSCTEIFSPEMNNCADVISEFYLSFIKVLNEAGFASSDCDLAVFCGHGSTVNISKCGGAKLFRYSNGGFSEVQPKMSFFPDGKSSYGVCTFPGSEAGDIFIMLNGSVAKVLPADLIAAVCASADGDIKKIISVISSQADKYGCNGAVSAIVIKLTEVENIAAVPAAAPAAEAEAPAKTESKAAALSEKPEAEAENTENRSDKMTVGSKFAFGVVIGIFVFLLAVLIALAVRGIKHRGDADATTTEAAQTTTEADLAVDESTTEEDTTAQTAESTTEETTVPPETTKRASEVSTTRNRDTASTTAEPTTEKPEEKTEPEPTEEPATVSEEPSSEDATAPQDVTDAPTDESTDATEETDTEDAADTTGAADSTEENTDAPREEPVSDETSGSSETEVFG